MAAQSASKVVNVQLGNDNVINYYQNGREDSEDCIEFDGNTIISLTLRMPRNTDKFVITINVKDVTLKIRLEQENSTVERTLFSSIIQRLGSIGSRIRSVFSNALRLREIRHGSIIIELSTASCESINSILESLNSGSFVQFIKELFDDEPVLAMIRGETVRATVEICVPQAVLEKEFRIAEKRVEEAILAVQQILDLDNKEHNVKMKSCNRMRDVGREIERKEAELRTGRNVAAGVAALGTGLAVFTLGASLLVAAAAAGTAAVVYAIGAAIMKFLEDNEARRNAQSSVDNYSQLISDYGNILTKAKKVRELRGNPEVLKPLEAVKDRERRRLLQKYFEDESSVRVNTDLEVQVDDFAISLSRLKLMNFFGYLLNTHKRAPSDAVKGIRSIADQVERFQILEEVQ